MEPLDAVYVSNLGTSHNRYHQPDRTWASLQITTRCGRLLLMDCEQVPEIEAVLTREPCQRCFTVRGRRQRILNLIVVAGTPDA